MRLNAEADAVIHGEGYFQPLIRDPSSFPTYALSFQIFFSLNNSLSLNRRRKFGVRHFLNL